MIIEVDITSDIFNEAKARNEEYYNRFGNQGTHRTNKERQRMTGYLAESCIHNTFPSIKYSDDYSVDFILDNKTIDSKAQGCNSKPLDFYSATLYEEQRNRDTDYYIFSRIKNDFSKGWICGIASKQKFFQLATLKPAGTKTNNFTYDQSRYELQYKNLGDMYKFMEWHQKNHQVTH
tara:strand:- start:1198 stop:1728 length:531 start_codon:yes stop_codon:yes gene_type:complete